MTANKVVKENHNCTLTEMLAKPFGTFDVRGTSTKPKETRKEQNARWLADTCDICASATDVTR